MFWLRGDAQQRQSTCHMLSAAGDVESAAQKHRDETFVFESSGESSQPPPTAHSEQK